MSYYETFLNQVPEVTQAELAKLLQCTPATISRWKKNPPSGTLDNVLFRFLSEGKTPAVLRKLNNYAGQPLPTSRLDELAPLEVAPDGEAEVLEEEPLEDEPALSVRDKIRRNRKMRQEEERAAILEQKRLEAEERANFDLGKYVEPIFLRVGSWKDITPEERKVLKFHGIQYSEFLDAHAEWESAREQGTPFDIREYTSAAVFRDDVEDDSRCGNWVARDCNGEEDDLQALLAGELDTDFDRLLGKVPKATLEEWALLLQVGTSTISRWKVNPPEGASGILFRFLSESQNTAAVLRKLNSYAEFPLTDGRIDDLAPGDEY